MRATILLLVLAACGGSRPAQVVPPSASVGEAPTSTLAEARAFERGTGRPRNYRKAVAIYEELCRDGAGDRRACRDLLHAIAEARGTDEDALRVVRITQKMCEHDSLLGCAIAGFMGLGLIADEERERMLELVEARAETACEEGDPDACEAALESGSGWSQSGSAEAREHELAGALCKLGVLDGCTKLIVLVTYCGGEDPPDEVRACVEEEIAKWKKPGYEGRLHALSEVQAACDAGDADGCAALPGREIPLADLCKAHDYGACAQLGCAGDAQAAETGRAHKVRNPC